MNGRAGFSTKCWRILRWAGLAAAVPALWACTSRTLEKPTIAPTATVGTTFTQKINNKIDILFMIDNSSSMQEMQQKLYEQLPNFMTVLEGLQTKPDLHIAVVSSDMGAPSDTNIGCKAGDGGQFQSVARGSCLDTTLASGATYIIDDGNGNKNYTQTGTNPIGTVFQCIALLGDSGCGFEHQLASIDHALGSDNFDQDGKPQPPSTNAGFLRDDAYLGIVILTNEDDCSATPPTPAYSLNGGQQNISNPDGPITNYRCNGGPHGGHLCKDPGMGNSMIVPPLTPPSDASGNPPVLNLAQCEDNPSGDSFLKHVSDFVEDIKRLKPQPDDQILVAAITAPATPYGVVWFPASGGQNTQPGEVWPQVYHSCGDKSTSDVNPDPTTQNATDGSFGDPGVRITQFVTSFSNSVVRSICDASYAASMNAIATKLGALITPPCITQTIQVDTDGHPMCSVIENVTNNNATQKTAIPFCGTNNNSAPCWDLMDGMGNCSGKTLTVNDPAGMTAQSENSTVNCSICLTGTAEIGCPCPTGGKLVQSADDLQKCQMMNF